MNLPGKVEVQEAIRENNLGHTCSGLMGVAYGDDRSFHQNGEASEENCRQKSNSYHWNGYRARENHTMSNGKDKIKKSEAD